MRNQIFIPNIFQSEALEKIDKATHENEKTFLIVMPPGTGKTYLAAQWFKLQLKNNPKARLLFVCHNQDILSQANDKEFANCLSEFDIPRGYYNRSEKNIGQVTFATVQTLSKNLDKLPSDYFDYIIVDEAHHYRAKSFETAIKHFSPKVLLGLTATPYRMDGRPILDVFGKTIYNASISSGIKNGLLSKIRYYFVDNDIDFSEIKHDSHGRYDKKDLNKKLCIKEYDDAIIKEYTETVKQKYNKKKTICFCATVEHVYRMEKLFNDNGIKAIALAAKRYSEKGKEVTVHDSRRKQIINMFKNGDYDIIFVRDLFNEGIDIPDADCIMMLRPTESSRIFTQQIGRGLRFSKEKNYLLTLDFTGNCHRCNINYEVLKEIMELDIEKDVRDRIRNDNNISEIIIQNIGCEVRLSKRKIDVIKGSEEKTITKERLIENYYNVKNNLDKIPTCTEINVYGEFSKSTYLKRFGSWNKFLLSIGEKIGRSITTEITKEDLIKNYWDLKNKYPDLTMDMVTKTNGSRFDKLIYPKRFGSWNKFLLSIGEKLNYRLRITKEDLIKNYWDLKNKYPDLTSDIVTKDNGSQFHLSTYIRYFGSWKKFLETIGEKIIYKKRITEEELIKNYWNLKRKYPNLTSKMINKKNGSRFGNAVYQRRFGSWKKFLKTIGEKLEYKKRITEEELIKNYFIVKNKLNRVPTGREMNLYGKSSISTYRERFGSWKKFLKMIGEKLEYKKNVILIPNYTPKNLIPDWNFEKSNKKSRYNYTGTSSDYNYTGVDKEEIRCKIIEKIQDGDTALILESPELEALKEIEKQEKNPKKIIIPNHYEFDDIATALKKYNTNLNIEVINTSVLQYLVDHISEHLNFLWLDYCGAFSYYIRDLDILFQREIREMKLILTFNTFDPKKQDDSYYFTNVIGYVLKKLRGKNEILLIEDISQRYKKTMFSIGFDIKILQK